MQWGILDWDGEEGSYKGHYRDNQGVLNMDSYFRQIFNFLKVITALCSTDESSCS